jgi:menaquinone reductase, molybdopterin-binding-like subunit
MERRSFIGLMAGAAAGTAAGLPIGRLFDGVLRSGDQHLDPPGGPEDYVLSVCTACPGSCGIRARRIGGRVVKIAGNALHPISGGRLCAKGQASIQALYHPDRIHTPLRRTGPRGSLASFKPDSWENALDEIAARLSALHDQQRTESFVFLHGGEGAGSRLAVRFAEAFGSPNLIHLDRGAEAESLALFLTQGIHAAPAYDLRGSEYILSLGCEFLEASASPVFTSRAYGDFRQTRIARRGKLVHADPRLSVTAASADEWIAIRPEMHGVFALGVAAAIVQEGLYDREFVTDHTAGFDQELRPLLEREFGLESVAARTGVRVNTILRVAREFAGSRGVALGPRKGPLLPGRLFDHLAAHVLNGLVGNIDQPGGVLVPDIAPLAAAPVSGHSVFRGARQQPRLDGRTAGSNGDLEQLAEAFRSGNPYRAEVVFISGADPVFAAAGDRFRKELERVPFVVSLATLPTDTALYSDWILPETHFLEQGDLHVSPPGVAFASASLAQPASPASNDARPLASVVLDLASRLQFADAFPWPDAEAYMRSEMEGLYAARRGAIMGTPFDEAWVRMMEGAGWWAPGYGSADELWAGSSKAGGWWDPFYDHGDWSRVLHTSTGRFEFRADVLREIAERTADSSATDAGTLSLQLFEPQAIAGGRGAELPFLLSAIDPTHGGGWDTWGEIHPTTARELVVRDGSPVRISSPQGSIVALARITDRVVPGAIAVPVGLGRENAGRWGSGVGVNPLRLIGMAREPVSSLLNLDGTRVVVTPATGTRRS